MIEIVTAVSSILSSRRHNCNLNDQTSVENHWFTNHKSQSAFNCKVAQPHVGQVHNKWKSALMIYKSKEPNFVDAPCIFPAEELLPCWLLYSITIVTFSAMMIMGRLGCFSTTPTEFVDKPLTSEWAAEKPH